MLVNLPVGWYKYHLATKQQVITSVKIKPTGDSKLNDCPDEI